MTSSQKDLVVQKTTITVNKTKQSHSSTPRIYVVPQCELRPREELITKKFKNSLSDGIQNSEKKKKKKSLRTQSSNTSKSHFYTKRCFPKGENKRTNFSFAKTNGSSISLLFSLCHTSLSFFSFLSLSCTTGFLKMKQKGCCVALCFFSQHETNSVAPHFYKTLSRLPKTKYKSVNERNTLLLQGGVTAVGCHQLDGSSHMHGNRSRQKSFNFSKDCGLQC